MLEEWIRMRVFLESDPKVIGMANFLAADRGFMDWLTIPFGVTCVSSAHEYASSNVTVSLVLRGLLKVWGMANERGKRDGDDFVLEHANFDVVDEIAKTPGFGRAMKLVEWAKEELDGDVSCVRFPNFADFNTSKEDRVKEQNRERQRRFRQRKKGPQGDNDDVTLDRNDRVEERRGEERRILLLLLLYVWIGGCKGERIRPKNLPPGKPALEIQRRGVPRNFGTYRSRPSFKPCWMASSGFWT